MGQQNSTHIQQERNAKSRQSTRSLPDASMHRSSFLNEPNKWTESKRSKRTTPAASSQHQHHQHKTTTSYEQNWQNFKENWDRAAAPYYAPSTTTDSQSNLHHIARSCDGNYGAAACDDAQRTRIKKERLDDNWSDVASDLYRIRSSTGRRHDSSSDTRMRNNTTTPYDVLSDVAAAASSKSSFKSRRYNRRGASECGAVLSRVPEHQSDVRFHSPPIVANNTSTTAKLPDVYKKRSKSVQDFRPPPLPPLDSRRPRIPESDRHPDILPPKATHYYSRLEKPSEEKWIDYPLPKINYERSFSNSTNSPATSPMRQGSSECDKLIIQSLKAELSSERSLRIESSKRIKKDAKEMAALKVHAQSLEAQVELLTKSFKDFNSHSDRKDRQQQDLEETCAGLNSRVEKLEEEKSRLTFEMQQQKIAYDKCLDDIAEHVARAVINQKTLKSECFRLQKRVLEVEAKNVNLLSHLENRKENFCQQQINRQQQRSIVASSLGVNLRNTMMPSTNNKFSTPRDDFHLKPGSAPSCESILSFGDQNFLALESPAAPTTSPLSNGGEALCSRPTSFNFDAFNDESLLAPCFNNHRYEQAEESSKRSFANFLFNDSDNEIKQNSTPDHRRGGFRSFSSSPGGDGERRRPSTSDGSNETLCLEPASESDKEKASTMGGGGFACKSPRKLELVVNMMRTLRVNFPDVVDENGRNWLTKKINSSSNNYNCVMTTALNDDGYSTMSSENFVELLKLTSSSSIGCSSAEKRGPTTTRLKGGRRRWHSEIVVDDRDGCKMNKQKTTARGRAWSDSDLLRVIGVDKERLAQKAEKLLMDDEQRRRYSETNDLTEFERDFLLTSSTTGQQGEALIELDEDDKKLIGHDFDERVEAEEQELVIDERVEEGTGKTKKKEEARKDVVVALYENVSTTTRKKVNVKKASEYLNDSSSTTASSSYTTDDDSEDDGSSTMREWFKQLKIKIPKSKGKKAAGVVRYVPPRSRPSVLRRDVFHRFGKQERNALMSFDFLDRDNKKEQVISRKPSTMTGTQRRGGADDGRRRSGSFTTALTTNDDVDDDYQNLPYHRLTRTLSADFVDQKTEKGRRGLVSDDKWRHWDGESSSSSLEWGSSSKRSVGGSSLYLSELCIADRTATSSSSSLSFSTF